MRRVKTGGGYAGLLLAGMVAASSVQAQPNWAETPVYGTANLESGFTPDPWTQDLQAGGGGEASDNLASGCRGFINFSAPDVDLNYESGNFSLYIYADSDSDTTLVVNAPDGSWHCDDDSGDGLNPMVTFRKPQRGNYNIWVGVYSNAELQPATLNISELDPG